MDPLILYGTSIDGPNEETRIDSLAEAASLFSNRKVLRFQLTGTSTEVTLPDFPWNNTTAFSEEVNQIPQDLFFPYFQTIQITSGWSIEPPQAGERTTYFFPFGRPVTLLASYRLAPSDSDVLDQIAVLTQSGYSGELLVRRVGGTPATFDLGGVHFESYYPGSRYNSSVIGGVLDTTHGCGFTITSGSATSFLLDVQLPPGWTGLPAATIPFNSADDLIASINPLTNRRRLPFRASQATKNTALFSLGSYALSGGDDNLDPLGNTVIQSLNTILQGDPADSNVICMTGWDYSLIINSAVSNIDQWNFPSFLILNQPVLSPTLNYTSASVPVGPSGHARISITLGNIFSNLTGGAAWMNFGPAYAGVLARDKQVTREGIGSNKIDPIFSFVDLPLLAASGYVTLTRSISNGVVIYAGVPSLGDWPLTTWRAYQRICTRLQDGLIDSVGNTIEEFRLNNKVADLLTDIPGILDISADSLWNPFTGVLLLNISFTPIGEVTSVTVQLSIRL